MASPERIKQVPKLFEKVSKKDPRITVKYFNTIFGFFNYYSTSAMGSFIRFDKYSDDPRTYDVIFDALTILDESLPDYSDLIVQDIVDAYSEYSLYKQNISRSQFCEIPTYHIRIIFFSCLNSKLYNIPA